VIHNITQCLYIVILTVILVIQTIYAISWITRFFTRISAILENLKIEVDSTQFLKKNNLTRIREIIEFLFALSSIFLFFAFYLHYTNRPIMLSLGNLSLSLTYLLVITIFILYLVEQKLRQFFDLKSYLVAVILIFLIIITYWISSYQVIILEHLLLTGFISLLFFVIFYYIFNEKILSYLILLIGYFMPFSIVTESLITPETNRIAAFIVENKIMSIVFPLVNINNLGFEPPNYFFAFLVFVIAWSIFFVVNIRNIWTRQRFETLILSKEKNNKNFKWDKYDSKTELKSKVVLALHGLNGTYTTWNELAHYIREKHGTNVDLIAINFTNKLMDELDSMFDLYYINKSNEKPKKTNTKSSSLNNYIWELLLTLEKLKNNQAVQDIHIVCHSTSGLILRHLLYLIKQNNNSTSENYKTCNKLSIIFKNLFGNNESFENSRIKKISFFGVPHYGANGGSATLGGKLPTCKTNYPSIIYILRLRLSHIIDNLGRGLVSLLLDSQAALHLNPHSKFMSQIGNKAESFNSPIKYDCHNFIKNIKTENFLKIQEINIYDFKLKWYNLAGYYDRVVGTGAILCQSNEKIKSTIINANHSNTCLENIEKICKYKIRKHEKYTAINKADDGFDFIFDK
jgi:hypothetical protein